MGKSEPNGMRWPLSGEGGLLSDKGRVRVVGDRLIGVGGREGRGVGTGEVRVERGNGRVTVVEEGERGGVARPSYSLMRRPGSPSDMAWGVRGEE